MPEQLEFWHWWVLGALLMAIEVFAPTTLFLWTGISAGVVGLVLLIAPDTSWETQVLLFAVLSVVSVFAWRYFVHLRPARSEDPWLNRRAEQYIGRELVLGDPIVNGQGKVKVDDTTWKVEGQDLAAGSRVRVVGVEGVILKVDRV